MELEGTWAESRYGLQFQVERWQELVPPTIEGILGYLSSGVLKGIGPKTAEDIVQRFGTDALNVIENQPDKLLEVRGITAEKLEEIKAGYAESKAVRDLMTVLAPFKITPKTANTIYEHFGPDGAALLRKSFYQLCQISGFGFKRVDAIVRKSGGDLHDPMRVQGALFYTLEKSRTEKGHLYLEAEKLLGEALMLLNENIPQLDQRLQRPQLEQELRAMVTANVVVSKRGNIYLPHVFAQENETARRIAELLLDELFAFLRRNGTEEIIEAEDMDKYSNKMVGRGASKVHQLAAKHGLACRQLVWNPAYKGIDDWQLALRREKEREAVHRG